jgi:dTMP kinase
MSGLFINIEGPDGAGKTTQIDMLVDELEKAGVDFVFTKEPGGTEMAEEIRHTVKKKRAERVYPFTELLLFFAARHQNHHNFVLPNLKLGRLVLTDRHTPSTLAYQSSRGIDSKSILLIDEMVMNSVRPDLTILLDISVEDSRRRLGDREETVDDRLDQESEEFMSKVRESYLKQATECPDIFHIIDASTGIDEIHAKIKECVFGFIAKRRGLLNGGAQ